MATSRTTFGSILNTITTAADMLTTTLNTIDTSVGMASTAIDDAARRQQARSKLDAHSYKRVIATEKAQELESLDQSVIDWLDGDSERTARFDKTYAELMAALA